MTIGHNGGPQITPDEAYPDREGFITVGRSLRNHPVVGFGLKGPYVPSEAWLDLIMECKFREGRVINGGRIMTIMPGQLVGAVSWLASRWQWTPKQVRIFLDRLESEGMITRGFPDAEKCDFGATAGNHGNQTDNQSGKHKGKQAHFLSICNYAIYQFISENIGQIKGQIKSHSEGQIKGKQRANKGQQYKEEHWNTGIQEKEEREEKGEALPLAAVAAPAPEALDCIAGFNAYNELAQRIGLPVARSLTPQRRKSMAARMREHGGFEAWGIALANVERSAFLRGNNNRGWRADLDFLLQASRFAKVVDGTYGNGAHADCEPKETQVERMRRLLGEMDQEKRT